MRIKVTLTELIEARREVPILTVGEAFIQAKCLAITKGLDISRFYVVTPRPWGMEFTQAEQARWSIDCTDDNYVAEY